MRANHLYVHVPFCARRCVYCDFSIAVRSRIPAHEYVDALARELDIRHRASSLALDTLYFGGGTPSKLGPDGVKRAVAAILERATLLPGVEVTLEANPEDVDAVAVRAWRDAGVNRVSLGVQSFDDRVLRWMHRTHDAGAAVRSVELLRDGGIANVSIDLIFATPASLGRAWRSDLDRAVAVDVPHVSVYGLTVEPRTPLGRWVARSDVQEEPEETFESEFLEAHTTLTGAGFEHYEVSNYGRPGMHSRHNWAYWQRKAYAGIGPSAHEFDGQSRRWNVAAYADWMKRLADGRTPTEGAEAIGPSELAHEAAYLALRTTTGTIVRDSEMSMVRRWLEAGWASMTGATMRLTAPGWLRLDSIATDLTDFRSRY